MSRRRLGLSTDGSLARGRQPSPLLGDCPHCTSETQGGASDAGGAEAICGWRAEREQDKGWGGRRGLGREGGSALHDAPEGLEGVAVNLMAGTGEVQESLLALGGAKDTLGAGVGISADQAGAGRI
jgi:hypothetical protein